MIGSVLARTHKSRDAAGCKQRRNKRREHGLPFRLTWESRGLVVNYSGVLPASEILACRERIAADPRFDDLRFVIVDMLAVQALSLRMSDVELIEAYLRGPMLTNAAIAVVFVTTDLLILDALASYTASGDCAYPITVRKSVADARSYLVGCASRRWHA